MLQYILAFLAGVISIISPCILPLIPVIFATSLGNWKNGFIFISSMILMFVFLGFLAGFLGSTYDLRNLALLLLLIFGFIMFFDELYMRFSLISSRILSIFKRDGVKNEKIKSYSPLIMGLLIGFIWSPCIGPIVGALLSYSATRSGVEGALMMLVYGFGLSFSVSSLIVIGDKIDKKKILRKESILRKFVGIFLILYSLLIITGIYPKIEMLLSTFIPV